MRTSSPGAASSAPVIILDGAGMDRDRLNSLVSVLSEFASTVLTDFSLQEILDHLVKRVVELLPVTGAGVTLISPNRAPQEVAASSTAALRFERLQTELGEGPCVAAYDSREPVAVPDLASAQGFPEFGPAAIEAGLAAVFAFPLRHITGCLGALDLYRSTPGALTLEDHAVAQTVSDVTTSYLLNAQTREQVRQASDQFRDSSLHDPLTGLPNRVLFQERLDHAALRASRSGKATAVLFADLDGFKLINDTYGHAVGDEVLAAVAARLSALVRPGDTLARVSGDEFLFLCEDLTNASDVDLLLARIARAFAEPFELAEFATSVSASVGSAYAGPGEAVTNRLVTQADTAMYQAKRSAAANRIDDDLVAAPDDPARDSAPQPRPGLGGEPVLTVAVRLASLEERLNAADMCDTRDVAARPPVDERSEPGHRLNEHDVWPPPTSRTLLAVVFVPGHDTEPDALRCNLCGRKQVVDPGLPYVKQTASFMTDHRCGDLDGDGTRGL